VRTWTTTVWLINHQQYIVPNLTESFPVLVCTVFAVFASAFPLTLDRLEHQQVGPVHAVASPLDKATGFRA
jgi:hypothetical protein